MVAVKVSIQGTLPGGEKWSVNPVYAPTSHEFPTGPELATCVAAVNALSIPAGLSALWNTNTLLTGCRIEAREQNTQDLIALAEGNRPTAANGTGAGVLPYQSALVLSLRTAAPGAKGRGRLYWPATGLALQASDLRVASSVVLSALNGAGQYLLAIKGALETTLGPSPLAVWSRTHFGASAVNSIRMGNIVDVQRRRRDSLAESYQANPFP